MIYPDMTMFFVDDPLKSAELYRSLFKLDPVDLSPTFALFVFPSGLKLGLWSRLTAKPAVAEIAGGAEICLKYDSAAAVDTVCSDWTKRGLSVLQEPEQMDFGYTFVVTDHDGNRLRVYCMADN